MKYAIIIAMLAGSAMAEWSIVLPHSSTFITNIAATNTLDIRMPNKTYYHTRVIEIPDSIIASAITNGTVCRVRGGHVWKSSAIVDVRVCQLCKAKQKRKEVWEDGQ
jgi:hypothetical protein